MLLSVRRILRESPQCPCDSYSVIVLSATGNPVFLRHILRESPQCPCDSYSVIVLSATGNPVFLRHILRESPQCPCGSYSVIVLSATGKNLSVRHILRESPLFPYSSRCAVCFCGCRYARLSSGHAGSRFRIRPSVASGIAPRRRRKSTKNACVRTCVFSQSVSDVISR